MKKKISAFEYAIMQTITPEETKNYEALSREEEMESRENKLINQAKKLKIKFEDGKTSHL